jgi:hypothetical protein
VSDWRNIKSGWEIPTESYSDQPYVVKTDDGAWLCAVTTGGGHEGQPGQHVVTMRSVDMGRTWSAPADVEPDDGPEASYAVLLKTPYGRVYCFYNHNTDNQREVIADDPPYKGGICTRVDSLGYYVFKYSDDHGRTWSDERHRMPVREFDIDRENAYGGSVRFFWNVGRPFAHDGDAYLSLHKVGGFGHGFFTRSEGVLVRSSNILTERDVDKLAWETLPEGDAGLRTPAGGGPIAEEQSYCVLSDGSFYVVYRTVDGHPCNAYSRDRGRTWSAPRYKTYADGRPMKHPRAANFVWRCANGKYLYWFHNHGGRDYNDRNPVWMCGGVEVDSPDGKVIQWSQPEIVLYDDDPAMRMSYPDLVEEDGRYFLTETQKTLARVHEIPAEFFQRLWDQFTRRETTTEGLALDVRHDDMPDDRECVLARAMSAERGFSIDVWAAMPASGTPTTLFDGRDVDGAGVALIATGDGAVGVVIGDGAVETVWQCDPSTLQPGRTHHIGIVVDPGPGLVLFVVDGKLHDGGEHRQFGWGRLDAGMHLAAAIAPTVHVPKGNGIERLRLYDMPLSVSDLIASHRVGVS